MVIVAVAASHCSTTELAVELVPVMVSPFSGTFVPDSSIICCEVSSYFTCAVNSSILSSVL